MTLLQHVDVDALDPDFFLLQVSERRPREVVKLPLSTRADGESRQVELNAVFRRRWLRHAVDRPRRIVGDVGNPLDGSLEGRADEDPLANRTDDRVGEGHR